MSKAKIKMVRFVQYEYNGKMFDSEDEAIEQSKLDVVNNIRDNIFKVIQQNEIDEILNYISTISNDELKQLRIYCNKDK